MFTLTCKDKTTGCVCSALTWLQVAQIQFLRLPPPRAVLSGQIETVFSHAAHQSPFKSPSTGLRAVRPGAHIPHGTWIPTCSHCCWPVNTVAVCCRTTLHTLALHQPLLQTIPTSHCARIPTSSHPVTDRPLTHYLFLSFYFVAISQDAVVSFAAFLLFP